MIRMLCMASLILALGSPRVHARLNLNDKPPKALLVQLQTRKSQVDYLQKHSPEKLQEFQHDVQGIMKATTRDFASNFDYCTVYFFIDTYADSIKNGKFEGYLLDKDMKPVQHPVLAEGDTSFFVAYCGAYMPQPENEKIAPGAAPGTEPQYDLADDDPTALKPTLLVLDHNYRVLKVPRPRTIKGYMAVFNGRDRDYSYRAKHFNLEYVPMATSYSNTIRKYYARIARRNQPRYY